MGEGGIRDLPAPKPPAPSATLADAGSAPGRDWAPGHDGASEDTPGEKSAEGRRGAVGAGRGFTRGPRFQTWKKGALGGVVQAVGRGRGRAFQTDGMVCAKARGVSVTPAQRRVRVGGGGAVRWGGGRREVRGSETRRTDPMSFLESAGAVGRRAVVEVGTEEPVLRVNQKRERKGQ